MLRSYARSLSLCVAAMVSTGAAHGQFYKVHNLDLGASATSPFTKTLQTDIPYTTQQTTNTVGFLFSLKAHPLPWAGLEFNYGYNKYSQVYANSNSQLVANVKSYNHELTAAYLFHPHFRKLQPFVGVGGGYIDFQPQMNSGPNQWRGAGLLEAGLDIPTHNPHFGFRAEGRSLYYRAPNFTTPIISSESWVVTVEPAGGVYVRF